MTKRADPHTNAWACSRSSSLLPVKEILDPLVHGPGFMHHGHWLVLQSRLPHAVVNILILLEHPQLHLRLHAHGLRKGQRESVLGRSASELYKVKPNVGL